MLLTSLRVKLSDVVIHALAQEESLTAMATATCNVDLTRYEAHDNEQMLCMYVCTTAFTALQICLHGCNRHSST